MKPITREYALKMQQVFSDAGYDFEVPEKIDSNTFRRTLCVCCVNSYLPINTLLEPKLFE